MKLHTARFFVLGSVRRAVKGKRGDGEAREKKRKIYNRKNNEEMFVSERKILR